MASFEVALHEFRDFPKLKVMLIRATGARYLNMANLPAGAEKAMVIWIIHDVFSDETFEDDDMIFAINIYDNR